ncbi:MAG: UDP-N-acetylmuramoyl-tripeptide--D-alanyl-D-alanine ligase [Pseudomonadota bacterium]|jgi:UDP-N-acetylmuramoyl-tripeptide--D-alanyl-D-alanine ligase
MSEMHLRLSDAAKWIEGARIQGDASVLMNRVHTDSRSVQAGDLFIALQGERFDAHDFLAQVSQSGASAAMIVTGKANTNLPCIEVADTRKGLGQLAKGWRSQLHIPVIAVTGSNGKTTVTQMLASILYCALGDGALATQGNLNNDIGVPQTLLRLRASHRGAVVELGMNHPGEIAWLAEIAQPTVGLVNNAQREHQEFMVSVEAVAKENGAVIAALPADGVAVFPADDAYASIWKKLAGQRACMTFSMQAAEHQTTPADVCLNNADWQDDHWLLEVTTPQGSLKTQLHCAGRHNVSNALAATAAALAANIAIEKIAEGLAKFQPVKGRSRAYTVHVAGKQVNVVDDSYNANPDSVKAAIDLLAELPKPQILVLGDMGEVGDDGPEFHREVGLYAQHKNIDTVLCLGELTTHTVQACGACAQHFSDIDTLHLQLRHLLPKSASVLVKGSRFMKMERVLDAIANQSEQHTQETTPC